MATHSEKTFTNQNMTLDGNEFFRNRFEQCTVFISRGNFVLAGNEFVDCKFIFSDEAAAVRDLVLLLIESDALPPHRSKRGKITLEAEPAPAWLVHYVASPKGVDPFSNLKLLHGTVAA